MATGGRTSATATTAGCRSTTWTESGGLHFADRADHASRREQTTVGEEIVRQQGWEAWPSCARELGLLR
ncbi:transglycosylase family protein [Kitasatospora cathayae]|uniref:Transglycosylase family protein n=1 Tax=Kitasatospora cathayae TaxID=3004092 RepID=A0ABY7Q105_9ACTN|nr:transglycosylase family protein [Kitasatospora sp. HUAS 3-15]WBP86370.1 transglycosylase family protein [Kitasatospora sp. HUAS 3-15]